MKYLFCPNQSEIFNSHPTNVQIDISCKLPFHIKMHTYNTI